MDIQDEAQILNDYHQLSEDFLILRSIESQLRSLSYEVATTNCNQLVLRCLSGIN